MLSLERAPLLINTVTEIGAPVDGACHVLYLDVAPPTSRYHRLVQRPLKCVKRRTAYAISHGHNPVQLDGHEVPAPGKDQRHRGAPRAHRVGKSV